jgi:ATP-binding cassette, subfamily B, bacterial PglK
MKLIMNDKWISINFIYLQIIFFFLTIFEIFNLGLIVPFLYSIIDFQNLSNNQIFLDLFELFNIELVSQRKFIFEFGIIIICLFLINIIFQILLLFFISKFIENTAFIVQSKIYRAFFNLNYKNYTSLSSSKIYNLFLSEILRFSNGYLTSLLNINQRLYSLIILIILLSLVNFTIVLILLSIFISIYYLFFQIFKKEVNFISKEITILNKNRILILKSTFNLFDLILINKIQNFFIKQFDSVLLLIKKYNIKAFILSTLPRQIVESLFLLLIILFTMFVFYSNKGTGLNSIIQELITISLISVKLVPNINIIYNNYIKLRANKNSYHNIKSFLNSNNKEFNDIWEKNKKNINLFTKINSFSINKLNFKYKTKKIFPKKKFKRYRFYMKKLNFIFGDSGSGKSTLLKILIGLLKPELLEVKFSNGKIIKNNSLFLSNYISYIPQQVSLYPGSIIENVALGNNKIDKKKVIYSLKKAQIYNYVNNLKNKLDTMMSEDMLDISGGQIQRIALARALYEDKPFIVLDEVLSGIDEKNKSKILTTLENFCSKLNKTVIIISHEKNIIKKKYNLISLN